MTSSGKTSRKVVAEVLQADRDLSDVVDNLPPLPKSGLSIQQLQTAAAHMRAALRLVEEVAAREVPLQDDESDWTAAEDLDSA